MDTPKWLETAVFYNIYPQSFFDSNADGIGDLNGITEKLDYIQRLGCNAIWLNPIYPSPFRDAGYDVSDFYDVASRYGCIEDLENLCSRAHDKGIKVVLDLVVGHTSVDCEWFRKSQKQEPNEYSNRYIWTRDWLDCPESFVSGIGERNGCYMKNFFVTQPALNYGFAQVDEPEWQLPISHPDCKKTKQELISVMEFWMKKGCDGFRVDMAASVVKNDKNSRGTIAFWQEIRELFNKNYPDKVLISEWGDPHEAIQAGFHIDFLTHCIHPAYTKLFRAEKGRSVNRDFIGDSFFSLQGRGNLREFTEDYLEEYNSIAGKGYISIPTGNHDLPRISYGRTKKEIELVFAFLLTMPGVPFIYYGDEIGMNYNKSLPSKEGGYTRTGSRTPMQWTDGKNAGFSMGRKEDLYLPCDEGVNAENVLSQEKDPESLLCHVKNLINFRRQKIALCAAAPVEFRNYENNGYPLVYRRWDDSEEYLICINPTEVQQEYVLASDYTIELRGGNVELREGKIILPPVSYVVLRTSYLEK